MVRQDREDGCRTTVEFHRREGRFSAVQPERWVVGCLDVVDMVMRVECRERSADSEGIRGRVAVRSVEVAVLCRHVEDLSRIQIRMV